MLNQSYKTSMGYKWGGLAVVIFASFLFNGLVWAALALLPGERNLFAVLRSLSAGTTDCSAKAQRLLHLFTIVCVGKPSFSRHSRTDKRQPLTMLTGRERGH